MRQRTTCDRCYKIKARCVYDGSTPSCSRCFRLGHECVIGHRLVRLNKSRSFYDHTGHIVSISRQSAGQLVRLKQPSPWPQNLTHGDMSCIDFLLQPEQIAKLLYGQNFNDSMRSAMAAPVFIAADQVKDGYVALAGAISESQDTRLQGVDQPHHTRRGSQALQILRKLKPSSLQEARIALSLALVLVTYSDLAVGGPTLPIVRSALLQAKPYWQRLSYSDSDGVESPLICLLFCEMFECLVLGQMPVFRYETILRTPPVDRYYGICQDLLPYFYDICQLCKSIKENPASDHWVVMECRRLNNLIARWHPSLLIIERTQLLQDHTETQHFLLQAKSFKCALELLLMQAQRSPGMDLLARAKAFQLEQLITQARQSGTGKPKYLLFPYFLVCIELYDNREGQKEEVLKAMNDISNGNAPMSCNTMVTLLTHIWEVRQTKSSITWFQCIGEGLNISMGP